MDETNEGLSAAAAPVHLSNAQATLYRVLRSKSELLARIYLGALVVKRDAENPDRLALCAHNLRELMEHLAPVLDVPMPAHDESLKERVRSLESDWGSAVENSNCHEDGMWKGDIDRHLNKLLASLGEFIDWANGHMPRRSTEVRGLLRRVEPSSEPLPDAMEDRKIKWWTRTRQYFVAIDHHGRTAVSEEEFTEMQSGLERFLLESFSPPTFTDFGEIERLLMSEQDDG